MRNLDQRSFGADTEGIKNREVMEAARDIIRAHAPKRLRPTDFRNSKRHSATEIDADEKLTQDLREKFREKDERELTELSEQTDSLRARALEIIIGRLIEDYVWFGDNFYFAHASEYDDFVNKVDGILEYYDKDTIREHLALAIDATKSADFDTVSGKIRGNADRLLGRGNGPRSTVKYFESPKNGEQSKLYDVVPVVVGIDGNHLSELIMLFAGTERLRAQLKSEPENAVLRKNIVRHEGKLATHPAATIFMKEILGQLKAYEVLLDREPTSDRKTAAVVKIGVLSQIFERALADKPALEPEMEDDGTYGAIKAITGSLRRKAV